MQFDCLSHLPIHVDPKVFHILKLRKWLRAFLKSGLKYAVLCGVFSYGLNNLQTTEIVTKENGDEFNTVIKSVGHIFVYVNTEVRSVIQCRMIIAVRLFMFESASTILHAFMVGASSTFIGRMIICAIS